MALSCGAPTGSASKKEDPSDVLSLLLAQDNFDGEDFDVDNPSGDMAGNTVEDFDGAVEEEVIEEDEEEEEKPFKLGCTDPRATNFDPEATENDGTCIIPDEPRSTDRVHVGTAISDLNPNGGYKFEVKYGKTIGAGDSVWQGLSEDYKKKIHRKWD